MLNTLVLCIIFLRGPEHCRGILNFIRPSSRICPEITFSASSSASLLNLVLQTCVFMVPKLCSHTRKWPFRTRRQNPAHSPFHPFRTRLLEPSATPPLRLIIHLCMGSPVSLPLISFWRPERVNNLPGKLHTKIPRLSVARAEARNSPDQKSGRSPCGQPPAGLHQGDQTPPNFLSRYRYTAHHRNF